MNSAEKKTGKATRTPKSPPTDPVSLRLDKELNALLDKEAHKVKGPSKSEIIEEALRDRLKRPLSSIARHVMEFIEGADGRTTPEILRVLDESASIFKVLDEHRNEPPLPKEMKWAVVDFLTSFWRHPEQLKKEVSRDFYTVVKYDYAHFDELQRTIERAAYKLPEFNNGSSRDFQDSPNFDIVNQPDLLFDTAILFPFPFYLVERRRSQCGVIPYGCHRQLAFLVTDKFYEATVTNWTTPGSNEIDQSFHRKIFDELLRRVHHSNGCIYHFRGFVYEEILPMMVRDMGFPDVKQFFSIIKKDSVSLPAKQHQAGSRDEIKTWKVATEKLKGDDSSVFALDLVISNEIEAENPSGFKVIKINHGLTIPVGIGFTLPLLPKLLTENNWETLQQAAISVLKQKEMESKFKKIGIEIQSELWKRTT